MQTFCFFYSLNYIHSFSCMQWTFRILCLIHPSFACVLHFFPICVSLSAHTKKLSQLKNFEYKKKQIRRRRIRRNRRRMHKETKEELNWIPFSSNWTNMLAFAYILHAYAHMQTVCKTMQQITPHIYREKCVRTWNICRE